jgi:hypothetical protein
MTAEEIRKHWNVVGNYPPEMIGEFALVEIAAQLAELNAFLREKSVGNYIAVATLV